MAKFRFTVGPWNVHEGHETFGPGIRPSISFEEKIKKFAEIGMGGVQSVYRMLSDDFVYCELHNALTDAMDELEIMRLLNHKLDKYTPARIG